MKIPNFKIVLLNNKVGQFLVNIVIQALKIFILIIQFLTLMGEQFIKFQELYFLIILKLIMQLAVNNF